MSYSVSEQIKIILLFGYSCKGKKIGNKGERKQKRDEGNWRKLRFPKEVLDQQADQVKIHEEAISVIQE